MNHFSTYCLFILALVCAPISVVLAQAQLPGDLILGQNAPILVPEPGHIHLPQDPTSCEELRGILLSFRASCARARSRAQDISDELLEAPHGVHLIREECRVYIEFLEELVEEACAN